MRLIRIHNTLLIAVLVVVLACKKDDGPELSTKEKFLAGSTSKSWKITGLTGKPTSSPYNNISIDFYNNKISAFGFPVANEYNIPMPQECEKDNLYVLAQEKTFEIREGATKCNPADPDVISSGTWMLNEDETVLTLSSPAGAVGYKITDLNESAMKGEATDTLSYNGNEIVITLFATFAAQ